MNTEFSGIKENLQQQGIKPTFLRLKIMEYLGQHRDHPPVENIYRHLRRHIPTVSKTTVYNTVNTFLKAGVVSLLKVDGLEARIDILKEFHHHFICRSCGTIIDIPLDCQVFRKKEVQGHRVEEVYGYFKGLCRACLRKKEKA